LGGVLLKHGVDLAVAASFHRDWTIANYLVPLGVPISLNSASAADQRFLAAMLGVSLPFAWVGLAITVKRFRAIGWPAWLVLLFFVPVANIVSFALASAWPETHGDSENHPSSAQWLARIVPRDQFGSAVLALLLTSVVGAAFVAFGANVTGVYGWGVFAGIPFVQGALAALIFGVHARRPLWASISVAMISVGLTALALLALAFEGVMCIVMATPIALAFAVMGAVFGHVIQRRSGDSGLNPAAFLVCLAIVPAIMGAEWAAPGPAPTYAVSTSVDIDAPAEVVWRNVISFPALPPPTELVFRAGIAYPERAKIVGGGVGAVRYCEFSTGSFVEPITVWQRARMLAFDVVRNPEPMREWSPYGHIETPHLRGYMVSRKGQFELEPLPGGRTRLTGTTWYQHHLWPAAYWTLWSDAIIHDIHFRVLNHIKTLSEASGKR
jgi:hypothetical protein